ncbi:DUF1275 family protein [Novosphingobium tardum]|uniref:DUF1275 family protein n=2 Tax=Novosphingobium tardum TaxID=1538021 RepID=A0ABV8RNX6_9SPHN
MLAACLALLAGFVDAVGFLRAGGYFVSFMSGNSTRLAVDAQAGLGGVLIPLGLIGGFVGGVILGALAGRAAGARRKPAVLGLVALLLIGASIAARVGAPALVLEALVLAMGALNNVFQRDGEVAIGVTYMTGTLVRLGQGVAARIGGEEGTSWLFNLALWASLVAGAIAGAAVQVHAPALSLPLAASWAAAMTAWAVRLTANPPAGQLSEGAIPA